MSFDFIEVSEDKNITRIKMNRPDVLNAINQEMHDELQKAFDNFANANDQYLAVISGAGSRAFSAGSDLKAIAKAGRPNVYPENGYAGLIERFNLNKPMYL